MTWKTFVGAALVAAAGLLVASAPAEADPINQRERRQRHRIVAGIRNGDLTRGVARRLIAQQRRIHLNELRFRLSGRGLTWRERARLHNQLDRASRAIYRQRHDWQRR
jgi:hypothetical protein